LLPDSAKTSNMNFKVDDWVRHPKYGDGQVAEDRGDKLVIQFVSSGERLMLKNAIDSAGEPPYPGFTFRKRKASGTPRFKVLRVVREPAADFDHLVKRFLDVFEGGFDGESFNRRERLYKQEAVNLLCDSLGKQQLDELIKANRFEEVSARALRIVHKTNLIFRQEIIQFNEALKASEFQFVFALGLRQLLYETTDPELRFNAFTDALTQGGIGKWTIATYFQFLLSNGEMMFMKPAVIKSMAETLNVALNYRPEPNWLTYCKMQELAKRVDRELRARGLNPSSGIDVQGFIWSSIRIEEGKYGKNEP
jgi:hypothetical protein